MASTADYELGTQTFARGWFMVADSDDVTSVPHAVRYFGQDLVLYRGASGRAIMLDAYCAHMGCHLGANTTSFVIQDAHHVEGDSIRCPYHAWRYGPDGVCDDIPYFKGPIPAAAQIRSWPLVERYGAVFTWHDPESGEPDFDLPEIPEWNDPAWVHWKLDKLGVLPCHAVELIDNMADVAHLGPTHGAPPEYFQNEIDGIVLRQRQGGRHRSINGGGLLETDTYYTGPGVLLSHFLGIGSIMFITHTPVDDGTTRAWHGLLVKAANTPPTDADVQAARTNQEYSRLAFAQDFEIWTNKRPCFGALQLVTDGPFRKIRDWYKQFYSPRAQAAERQRALNGFYAVRDMPTDNPAKVHANS